MTVRRDDGHFRGPRDVFVQLHSSLMTMASSAEAVCVDVRRQGEALCMHIELQGLRDRGVCGQISDVRDAMDTTDVQIM